MAFSVLQTLVAKNQAKHLSKNLVKNLAKNLLKNGGPNRENQQGKDFWGVKGNLLGIFGNPSLVKNRIKNKEKPRENTEKPKNNK